MNDLRPRHYSPKFHQFDSALALGRSRHISGYAFVRHDDGISLSYGKRLKLKRAVE